MIDLEKSASVRVVTSDRDLGDATPYPNVAVRQWNTCGSAQVSYLRRSPRDWLWVLRELRLWRPEVTFINGLQHPLFGLFPIALWRFGILSGALMVAPRGQFSRGALARKALKKLIAHPFIKVLLGSRVTWLVHRK
jgi:hypothetical protein